MDKISASNASKKIMGKIDEIYEIFQQIETTEELMLSIVVSDGYKKFDLYESNSLKDRVCDVAFPGRSYKTDWGE